MTGSDFGRAQKGGWGSFEIRYKRNLKLSREKRLLNKVGYIAVSGLREVTEKSSNKLAKLTREV